MLAIFIFILESIGTQELVLVGIIALIVFGPRKLPQMARKFGGTLTELRKVSNDFRTTWEKEALFDDDPSTPAVPESQRSIGGSTVPKDSSGKSGNEIKAQEELVPEIREVSPEELQSIEADLESKNNSEDAGEVAETELVESDSDSAKRNWL